MLSFDRHGKQKSQGFKPTRKPQSFACNYLRGLITWYYSKSGDKLGAEVVLKYNILFVEIMTLDKLED